MKTNYPILSVLFLTALAFADIPSYEVVDLGINDCVWSQARSINDNGTIAGQWQDSSGKRHLFVWNEGQIYQTGAVTGNFAATEINNSNRIACWYYYAHEGAVFDEDPANPGTWIEVDRWPGAAFGINNLGQVAGWHGSFGSEQSIIWNAPGSMEMLGKFEATVSYARDINESGDITGTFGQSSSWFKIYRILNGVWEDIGRIEGERDAIALEINDNGYVVGAANFGGTMINVGVLCKPQGSLINLGTLPGFNGSVAMGINNNNVIVGSCTISGTQPVGCMWIDEQIINLNDCIDTNSGWMLTDAQEINDAGCIVGSGTYQGQRRAILLVPTVEEVQATIDIDPDTLNLKSKGNWVTVYITLPEGYSVSDISYETIKISMLNNDIYEQPADISFVPQVGDRDEDGILDLTVKFDRQVLIPNLLANDTEITVEGDLNDGTHFVGTDKIRVIDRGK